MTARSLESALIAVVKSNEPIYHSGMNRSRAMEILTESKPFLAERFGVIRLALFGSTARDQASPSSDVTSKTDSTVPSIWSR